MPWRVFTSAGAIRNWSRKSPERSRRCDFARMEVPELPGYFLFPFAGFSSFGLLFGSDFFNGDVASVGFGPTK